MVRFADRLPSFVTKAHKIRLSSEAVPRTNASYRSIVATRDQPAVGARRYKLDSFVKKNLLQAI